MTKAEIATYIGMANALLSIADEDGDVNRVFAKTRQALCEAQLLLTQQAIEEYKERGEMEGCSN